MTVVSNRKKAFILERARSHGGGINVAHIPCKKGTPREIYDQKVTEHLESQGVNLVLLIGYMRIVSAEFCARWKGRVFNVHPSLLPAFAGGMDTDVHAAVIAAGRRRTAVHAYGH